MGQYRQAMLRAAQIKKYHAEFVRYTFLELAARLLYLTRAISYNNAVANVNKYANLRNNMNARANAEARTVNALAKSHAALVKRINLTRNNCARSTNNMLKIAQQQASKQNYHHARYIKYRNEAAAFTRQFNNANRILKTRQTQRQNAYNSYKNLVNQQNAAAQRLNRLRG